MLLSHNRTRSKGKRRKQKESSKEDDPVFQKKGTSRQFKPNSPHNLSSRMPTRTRERLERRQLPVNPCPDQEVQQHTPEIRACMHDRPACIPDYRSAQHSFPQPHQPFLPFPALPLVAPLEIVDRTHRSWQCIAGFYHGRSRWWKLGCGCDATLQTAPACSQMRSARNRLDVFLVLAAVIVTRREPHGCSACGGRWRWREAAACGEN